MENPDIANAEYWLGWLNLIKNIGSLLAVFGAAMALLGNWFSGPLAKKVADGQELQITQLRLETAAAKERTVQIEMTLERERGARLAMLSQLKPRDFTKEQFDTFVSAVKGKVKQLTVFTIPDPEASQYGYAVMDALQKAEVSVNWIRLDSNVIKVQGVSSTGLTLYAPKAGTKAQLKELVETLAGPSVVESGILIHGYMGEPTDGIPVPSLFIALQRRPFASFPAYLAPPDLDLPVPTWNPK